MKQEVTEGNRGKGEEKKLWSRSWRGAWTRVRCIKEDLDEERKRDRY
jgi:hypothetical protein